MGGGLVQYRRLGRPAGPCAGTALVQLGIEFGIQPGPGGGGTVGGQRTGEKYRVACNGESVKRWLLERQMAWPTRAGFAVDGAPRLVGKERHPRQVHWCLTPGGEGGARREVAGERVGQASCGVPNKHSGEGEWAYTINVRFSYSMVSAMHDATTKPTRSTVYISDQAFDAEESAKPQNRSRI